MNKFIQTIAATAIVAFFVASCGKYEEGPKLSLASKTGRLAGEWALDKYMVNDTDQTAAISAMLGSNFKWTIEKDGKYTQAGNFTDNGTWVWGDGKESIIMTSSQTGATADTMPIIRLKSKELWFKKVHSNGDKEEIRLKQ